MAEHVRSGGGSAHPGSDDLAVLALDGGAPDDDVRAHLAACPTCAAQYGSFRATTERVHRALRHLGPARGAAAAEPAQPGDAVWQRIAAEVGAVSDSPVDAGGGGTASVTPLQPRVRPAWLAVAAVVVVLAVTAAVLAGRLRPAPDAATVATADLAPLVEDRPPAGAVLEERDGTLAVALELPPTGGAAAGTYYELWLIDEDVEGMVSLGPVREGRSRVPVPAGLDVTRFPIVDVSREAFDGDPRHSGDSLWRGELPFDV